MTEKKDDSAQVWKIAGGVVLALVILSTLKTCENAIYEAVYWNRAITTLEKAAADPDPLGWRAKAAREAEQRKQAEAERAQADAQAAENARAEQIRRGELQPGEACLNGELYSPRNQVLVPTGEHC